MKIRITRRALLALALAAATQGSDAKEGTAKPARKVQKQDRPLPIDTAVAEVNGFGARLFAARLSEPGVGNTVVSPLSLTIALQMAASGAKGKTEDAFRKALGLGATPMRQASETLSRLTKGLLREDEKLILRSANGIWLAHGVELQPAYVETQSEAFGARVESRDFSQPETLKAINSWFSDQTQQMIPEMLTELSPAAEIVLGNALYFKGQWQDRFEAKETAPGPFRLGGEETVEVSLMHRRGALFSYRETAAYQAVRLPFADGSFEVVVALPRKELNALSWAKELGAAGWSDVLDKVGFENRPGELALPRLKLAWGADVRPALERIGLTQIFGAGADFSGLAKARVRANKVIHRTVLRWDEEGAEAAAATAVAMGRSVAARPRPEPFRMVVDRPFVLALRHSESGTIVLLALVSDPREGVS